MKLNDVLLTNDCFLYRPVRSLQFVYNYVDDLRFKLQSLVLSPESSEGEILKMIRCISGEIYSCCEIINELLIVIYRNR